MKSICIYAILSKSVNKGYAKRLLIADEKALFYSGSYL